MHHDDSSKVKANPCLLFINIIGLLAQTVSIYFIYSIGKDVGKYGLIQCFLAMPSLIYHFIPSLRQNRYYGYYAQGSSALVLIGLIVNIIASAVCDGDESDGVNYLIVLMFVSIPASITSLALIQILRDQKRDVLKKEAANNRVHYMLQRNLTKTHTPSIK